MLVTRKGVSSYVPNYDVPVRRQRSFVVDFSTEEL